MGDSKGSDNRLFILLNLVIPLIFAPHFLLAKSGWEN